MENDTGLERNATDVDHARQIHQVDALEAETDGETEVGTVTMIADEDARETTKRGTVVEKTREPRGRTKQIGTASLSSL